MTDWRERITTPLREMRIGGSIVFGSGVERTLDGDMVCALIIEEGAGGALTPGCVLSASCRLDLVNDAGQWNPGGSLLGGNELTGATLMPRLGVLDGDQFIWRELGVFQVESALNLEGDGLMRLSGQDSIASELSAVFEDGLVYPQTLAALWRYAVGKSRYIWSGEVPNGRAMIRSAPDWKGASLRTALGCIAAAAGCFVRVDRGGSLELAPLWDAAAQPYAIGGEVYLQLESDALRFGPVDALGVTCVDEEGEKIFPAEGGGQMVRLSGNPLFRSDNPGLDTLAEGLLSTLQGYGGTALRFDWRGDPELCIGGRVAVQDLQGRVHSGVLSRQTLRFDGGFSAACFCDVPSAAASGVQRAITPEGGLNASALVGAVDGGLLRVGSVTTGKLAAGSVTAEKIAAGVIDAAAVQAVTAKIEQLTAGDIQTDSLAAALAAFTVLAAGTADFDRATVAHLVAHAMHLTFGTADEMYIDNLRVNYAQLASAAIGNLVIRAADGNYYAIDVNAEGHVSAVPVEISDGEISAGETEGGRVILDSDVTAGSLNTSSLQATYALINRIDAARIDVDQLFAREAFIAHLCTTDISSNSYIQQSIRDAAGGEVSRYLRLDENGLHVGGEGAGEVLIDSDSVDVRLGGQVFSSFGGNYVEFGGYQLRRTADGGLAFKLKEG